MKTLIATYHVDFVVAEGLLVDVYYQNRDTEQSIYFNTEKEASDAVDAIRTAIEAGEVLVLETPDES